MIGCHQHKDREGAKGREKGRGRGEGRREGGGRGGETGREGKRRMKREKEQKVLECVCFVVTQTHIHTHACLL